MIEKLKNYDWRKLKKYLDPKAADDLNTFLEGLPQHAGNTMLIIAGIAWGAAGAVGLYTTVQMQKMTELRAELQEAQAISPVVPQIRDVSVSSDQVQTLVDRMEGVYQGLEIRAAGSKINITGDSTAFFGQFREAVGHVQSGGSGWRVSLDHLCVGRECKQSSLKAGLKINKVSVEPPQ